MSPKKRKKNKALARPSHQLALVDKPEGDETLPLFFFMPDAKDGEFCQWYPSQFTVAKPQISRLVGRGVDESDPDGDITFTCAEQFMMYCKAARFGDTARQARILATSSPKEQKKLGRGTVGFTIESWDEIKSEVAEAGNIAKFGQDLELRRKLLATGNRMLCEASPKDSIWGIGYSAKRAMAHDQSWGENRLGKALMVAREFLREEDANVKEEKPREMKMEE